MRSLNSPSSRRRRKGDCGLPELSEVGGDGGFGGGFLREPSGGPGDGSDGGDLKPEALSAASRCEGVSYSALAIRGGLGKTCENLVKSLLACSSCHSISYACSKISCSRISCSV